MGFRKWRLPQADPQKVDNLINQTGIPQIAAQILSGRGEDADRACEYLRLSEPEKMHGYCRVMARVGFRVI